MAVFLNVYLTDAAGSETEKIRVPNPASINPDGTVTDSDTVVANVAAIASAAKATVTGGGTLAVTNSGANVAKYRSEIEVSYTVNIPGQDQWIDIQ